MRFLLPMFLHWKKGCIGKKAILIENIVYSDVEILSALHPTYEI